MKKNRRNQIFLWCFVLMMMVLVTGCGKITDPIEKDSLTQIIAFGDSYSDNGGANRRSTEIMNSKNVPEGAYVKPGDVYWNNRYSNGKTAVEVLAQQIGIPLTNYATGGATSGESNYSEWMDCLGGSGLLGQISQFEKGLEGQQADSEALYFIFASANDFFYFMDNELSGKVEAEADNAVNNLKTAVRRLAGMGAENFLVVNSSDLTLVPYVISMKQEEEAIAFQDTVNKRLPDEVAALSEQLGVCIQIFDMQDASIDIVENAKDYGLKVLDKPCQPTYPEVKVVKSEEDSYYFWDEWHYTRAVHKILAEKMYQSLK